MITKKQKQMLERQYGTQHPDFPIVDWYYKVTFEEYREGYWQYVWDMTRKRESKNEKTYIPDPEIRHRLKQLRLAEKRGYTEEELVSFIDAGNSYAATGRRFGCSAQTARSIIINYRKKAAAAICTPKLPEDIRTMPLSDFSKLPCFTVRTSRYLRVSNHYDFNNQGTVGDLIKQGLLWQPNFGKKTLIEIGHILITRFHIPEQEFRQRP